MYPLFEGKLDTGFEKKLKNPPYLNSWGGFFCN